ncbi:MAG: F0F1 ATP synthase subunit epsilon [Bacteroidota bacterium]|nr:F0F1 ATP synthase subunit epsilon [Bacteroidota bacterium]
MANLFDLEIVTPQRVEFTGQVASVNCPGAEGRFQVLHNHAPFLSSLDVGLMKVTGSDGKDVLYAVSGGIAQVFHNQMRVLADTAERSDHIDVQRARSAQQRAEQRLKAKEESTDVERARSALMRAINRLQVAERV